MAQRSDGTDRASQDRPPDRPFAPDQRTAGGAEETGADKAEPEKAKTEIEAGDVADELADFA